MTTEFELKYPEIAENFRHQARKKFKEVNEEFVAFRFEYRMCLRCEKASAFAILQTKRDVRKDRYKSVVRRWCCNCGWFHIPSTAYIWENREDYPLSNRGLKKTKK